MDSAKKAKMHAVGWGPKKSCATCHYGAFVRGPWGTCFNPGNSYLHGKHQRSHQLPAHVGVSCKNWEANARVADLLKFMESKETS